MADKFPYPLGGRSPAEISLPSAPLARVLAQVRFPGILKIDIKEVVAQFQEEIRANYPLFEQQPSQQIHLQVGAAAPILQQTPGNVWSFSDAKNEWRLILNNSSLSLDTTNYVSREDFVTRLATVLTAAQLVFSPQIALRIGLRYVDRVVGEPLKVIDDLVKPNMLGIATPELRHYVRHALTEATLLIEEGEMLLRWGHLPPNTTVQPGMLDTIPETSWILDIDVSSGEQRAFDSKDLSVAFRTLAERAYCVFRFMITDNFLRTYGAKL